MPELPEVETVCRCLSIALEGQELKKILLRRKDLRFPFQKGFCQSLEGKRVKRVARRAKYILILFTDGVVLICHLGMSGSFRYFEKKCSPLRRHDHVVFFLSNNKELRYCDPRRFGFMILTNETELESHSIFKNLGPEPINPDINGPMLEKILKNRAGPIKNLLLNQAVISGIGNIYACEALHRAGISPNRKAKNIKGNRAKKLAKSLVSVIYSAIDAGGTSLQDHNSPFGENGLFQNHFQVYGRNGKACKNCEKPFLIKKISQANRSTFYCSNCQR